jgi:hypothetical protein
MAERQDKMNENAEEGPLVSAAKVIGSAAGKVLSATGLVADATVKGQGTGNSKNLYAAEYLGSGTFHITKPKRKQVKRRQSQLKNPQRGARK